jgi:hypothetical protein
VLVNAYNRATNSKNCLHEVTNRAYLRKRSHSLLGSLSTKSLLAAVRNLA